MNTFLRFILLLIAFFFVFPTPSYAYLDPGTGSYLIQIMAATFFGGLYVVTAWGKQIKAFIVKNISRKDKNPSGKSSDKKE